MHQCKNKVNDVNAMIRRGKIMLTASAIIGAVSFVLFLTLQAKNPNSDSAIFFAAIFAVSIFCDIITLIMLGIAVSAKKVGQARKERKVEKMTQAAAVTQEKSESNSESQKATPVKVTVKPRQADKQAQPKAATPTATENPVLQTPSANVDPANMSREDIGIMIKHIDSAMGLIGDALGTVNAAIDVQKMSSSSSTGLPDAYAYAERPDSHRVTPYRSVAAYQDIYTSDERQWRREQQGISEFEYELLRVDRMSGTEFEEWCSRLLILNCFTNVSLTKASNDQGVDITAEKEGIKYAFQCKCYKSDLGNKPIQEINVGKQMYDCHVGVVITNSGFTKGAREAARATKTLLWDREELKKLLAPIAIGNESMSFLRKSFAGDYHFTV